MTFDEWKDAVNQALMAANRGFTIADIDDADLQSGFGSNLSPVIFARQASRSLPPLPKSFQYPSFIPLSSDIRLLTNLRVFFRVVGWAAFAFGLILCVITIISTVNLKLPPTPPVANYPSSYSPEMIERLQAIERQSANTTVDTFLAMKAAGTWIAASQFATGTILCSLFLLASAICGYLLSDGRFSSAP